MKIQKNLCTNMVWVFDGTCVLNAIRVCIPYHCIDIGFIFIAWKPLKSQYGSLSIFQKCITFAKGELAHFAGESRE